MRVAKFTDDVFADEAELESFFARLPGRNPPGLVLIPRRKVREGGLAVGEWVLFTYAGRVRYAARAASGRQDNTFDPQPGYPHCFVVDPTSVQPLDLPLGEVERRLRAVGVDRSLDGQGWTAISSEAAERVAAELTDDVRDAEPGAAADGPHR